MAKEIVLAGACRTAIGKFGGSLANTPAVELGALVIKEAVRRAGIKPEDVDEVLMGNVLQAGLGQSPARQAAIKAGLPESWGIRYGELSFRVRPMNFKHTGLFPEQAANWDWAMEKIRSAGRHIQVLNLFAYTGAATVACLAAGASVCHVDAAKGMVAWGKENAAASGVAEGGVRWIVDDCAKFVEREIRRGRRYDAIIMDPPSYGRGPGGEVWRLEDNLWDFVSLCRGVLSDDPLFVLINSYTTGLAPSVLEYISESIFTRRYGGRSRSEELGLPVTESGLVLPCGASCRWERR